MVKKVVKKDFNMGPKRPWMLSVVIWIHWFGVVFFVLSGLAILLGVTSLAESVSAGIALIMIGIPYFLLAKHLTLYNSTARTVTLFLSGAGIVLDLIQTINGDGYPIISIIVGGFIIYTLGFNKEVRAIFRRTA